MKRVIMVAVTAIILLLTGAKAQSLDRFFNKYDNDQRFESVSVSKFLINLALFSKDLKPQDRELLANLRKIKILTTSDVADAEFIDRIMTDLNKSLDSGNYENLLEVRDKGEHVNIYTRMSGQNYTDLLIAVKDRDEVSLVWLNGKLSQDIVNKIRENDGSVANLPLNIK